MHRCYSAEVYYLFIFNSGMTCNIPSPKVWQVVLPNIPVQSGIVHPDVWPPLLLFSYCGPPCLLF